MDPLTAGCKVVPDTRIHTHARGLAAPPPSIALWRVNGVHEEVIQNKYRERPVLSDVMLCLLDDVVNLLRRAWISTRKTPSGHTASTIMQKRTTRLHCHGVMPSMASGSTLKKMLFPVKLEAITLFSSSDDCFVHLSCIIDRMYNNKHNEQVWAPRYWQCTAGKWGGGSADCDFW